MKDIKIITSSHVAPKKIVSNDQLSKLMDTSDEWISKRTGIKYRHISNHEENTAVLASKVAQLLLQKSACTADEIDLIIVSTMSPDYLTPSTAAIVQGKIAASHAVAFDISAACSGFSYALSIARDLMLSHQYQKAIVIGAEVLSKILDWHDRTTAVLFGDGAGGVLLEASTQRHFLGQDLHTYGNLGDQLQGGHIPVAMNFFANTHRFAAFKMAGREVYRFATHKVPESISNAAKKADVSLDQIDHFLLHQANARIIEQVAKKIDQPLTKFPMNIAEYGNTAAASEAILLDECITQKIIKKNDLVALSGFGGGLTTATIIFKF